MSDINPNDLIVILQAINGDSDATIALERIMSATRDAGYNEGWQDAQEQLATLAPPVRERQPGDTAVEVQSLHGTRGEPLEIPR